MPLSNTDIRPQQYVLVAGTLVWSRISSQVDGDELREIQRQRQEHDRPAPARPYTSVTLIDPQIVQADRSKPLTIEERYVKENRFYESKNGYNRGHICFSPTNNGKFLPALYRKGNAANGENPKEFYQVHTKKEIARGTKVMVLMRSFAGQMNHNGIAMNAVLVLDDHINYYGAGSADAEALRQWGLIVNNDNQEENLSQDEIDEIAAKTERVSLSAPVPVNSGVPAQDEEPEADDTFDPNINQGISIDALFPDD